MYQEDGRSGNGRAAQPSFAPDQLTSWLVARVAEARGLDPKSIDVHAGFSHVGVDSLGAARIVAELGERLGRRLSPTLVWEYPSFHALAAHLAGVDAAPAAADGVSEAGEPGEPIAIVGMACRLPQAQDPAAFWGLLRAGRDAIGAVPAERGWEEALVAL